MLCTCPLRSSPSSMVVTVPVGVKRTVPERNSSGTSNSSTPLEGLELSRGRTVTSPGCAAVVRPAASVRVKLSWAAKVILASGSSSSSRSSHSVSHARPTSAHPVWGWYASSAASSTSPRSGTSPGESGL